MGKKSKLCWLSEGGENSTFFHRWTSFRKNEAFIAMIEDASGRLLNEERDIEEEILGYFSNLYGCWEKQGFIIEN